MYEVLIREMCGRERVVFEGQCTSVKQINYTLYKYHKEELILEYELV